MMPPDPFPLATEAVVPRSAQASSCVIRWTENGPEHLMLLVEFLADDGGCAILLNEGATEVLIAKLSGSLDIWREDDR